MIEKNTYRCLALAISLHGGFIFAQTQVGNDIDGEDTGDRSGWSVSMPNSSTVAIGAPENDENGGNSGHARVFEWNGSSWVQKGTDLDGDAAGDLFGATVDMPDANTLAVGAPQNDFADVDAGLVKVFEWNASSWVQKGNTIYGDSTSGFFGGLFGSSVSMPDANSIAIGAPWMDQTGMLSGEVKIFDWDGNDWQQRGNTIAGPGFSSTGSIVKMPSSNVVGIVQQGATVGNVGSVFVYEWDGNAWMQKGSTINGENSGDLSGNSIAMPDENTIAIGACDNDEGFPQAGHVRIFEWNGSAWVQKGSDIDGEAENDESGFSVSMPDANTVAVGAILNDGNGDQSGHVRIFKWTGADWEQVGTDIDGETQFDQSAYSVSMPDANTVAIGAILNDAVNGNQFANEAGHVRILTIEGTWGLSAETLNQARIYPNPTSGWIAIELGKTLAQAQVSIKNLTGQIVFEEHYAMTDKIELQLDYPAGFYFIEVSSSIAKAVYKITRE